MDINTYPQKVSSKLNQYHKKRVFSCEAFITKVVALNFFCMTIEEALGFKSQIVVPEFSVFEIQSSYFPRVINCSYCTLSPKYVRHYIL